MLVVVWFNVGLLGCGIGSKLLLLLLLLWLCCFVYEMNVPWCAFAYAACCYARRLRIWRNGFRGSGRVLACTHLARQARFAPLIELQLIWMCRSRGRYVLSECVWYVGSLEDPGLLLRACACVQVRRLRLMFVCEHAPGMMRSTYF